jgi:hypothetical protein
MPETLDQACKLFKDTLKASEKPAVPFLTPKGRTLYIVSSEARELRRLVAGGVSEQDE